MNSFLKTKLTVCRTSEMTHVCIRSNKENKLCGIQCNISVIGISLDKFKPLNPSGSLMYIKKYRVMFIERVYVLCGSQKRIVDAECVYCAVRHKFLGLYIYIYIYIYIFPMPPHVLMNFVVCPLAVAKCNRLLRLGRHEARLRRPDDMSGDLWRWNARGVLSLPKPKPSPPSQGKIPMVEPRIKPGTSWSVARDSDH
jgi:hypothetical protein